MSKSRQRDHSTDLQHWKDRAKKSEKLVRSLQQKLRSIEKYEQNVSYCEVCDNDVEDVVKDMCVCDKCDSVNVDIIELGKYTIRSCQDCGYKRRKATKKT